MDELSFCVSVFYRVFSSISHADARPLGFKVGVFHYGKEDNPCIRLRSTLNRKIEIAVETDPPATMCIKTSDGSFSQCSEVRYVLP